jgi:hypothetical protein
VSFTEVFIAFGGEILFRLDGVSGSRRQVLRWAAAVARLTPDVSRIIPGDWGKVESGWLAWPLLSRIVRFGSGGRIHQFLWQRSRAVSNAKQELGGQER